MLRRDAREATSYWLQLVVSVGIATLGLVVGSLDTEIRRASGVSPRLEILAVPDATAFAGLESTLLTPHAVKTATVAPPPSPGQELDAGASTVRAAVHELWPSASDGNPLSVDLDTAATGPLRLRIVHLGAALSADGAETLGHAIGARLSREAQVIDVAVPTAPLTRELGDLPFVASVASGIRATASLPSVNVCVTSPAESGRTPAADVELARTLESILATHPRVARDIGAAWSVRFTTGACSLPSGADAGVTDTRVPDAGAPDARVSDAGVPDAGG